MKKCEICSRPLEFDEGKLCPACKSEKSHMIKRVIEVIGATAALVVIAIISGFGGDRKA